MIAYDSIKDNRNNGLVIKTENSILSKTVSTQRSQITERFFKQFQTTS